jgi:hypothetical protein
VRYMRFVVLSVVRTMEKGTFDEEAGESGMAVVTRRVGKATVFNRCCEFNGTVRITPAKAFVRLD